MRNYFVAFVFFLIPAIAHGGTAQSVPGPFTAPIFESFQYTIAQAHQDEAADYNCMPKDDGSIPASAAGAVSSAYNGTKATAHACDSSGALQDWTADTVGGSVWFDFIKPPGIKWTVTDLSCWLYDSIPANGVATEDILFRVAYRDVSLDVEDTNVIEMDSNRTLYSKASVSPNFEIGTKANPAGMVVMYQVDADGGGGGNMEDIFATCVTTVKVEE